MKINKNIFIIIAIVSGLLVTTSSILLLSKDVIGFDFSGFVDKGCVPYNVFVSKVVDNEYSVNIKWLTKGKCVSFLQYGKKSDSLDLVAVDMVNSLNAREHSVTLEKLMTSEKYYFLINSDEQTYGISGAPLEFRIADL